VMVLGPSRQVGKRDRLIRRALDRLCQGVLSFQNVSLPGAIQFDQRTGLDGNGKARGGCHASHSGSDASDCNARSQGAFPPSGSLRIFRTQDWLICGLRRDQLPIRVTRDGLARKRPDIRDFADALGVAADHPPGLVAGGRYQLADELDGKMGNAALELGLDQVGRFDANEALVDLLAPVFALGDGAA
jgi:hypothetical protein